jgi:hypothetical protein
MRDLPTARPGASLEGIKEVVSCQFSVISKNLPPAEAAAQASASAFRFY